MYARVIIKRPIHPLTRSPNTHTLVAQSTHHRNCRADRRPPRVPLIYIFIYSVALRHTRAVRSPPTLRSAPFAPHTVVTGWVDGAHGRWRWHAFKRGSFAPPGPRVISKATSRAAHVRSYEPPPPPPPPPNVVMETWRRRLRRRFSDQYNNVYYDNLCVCVTTDKFRCFVPLF